MADDTKLCPLLAVVLTTSAGRRAALEQVERGESPQTCREAKCAWWSTDQVKCAVLVVAEQLQRAD
jgi:hypothetical protein